MPDIEACEVGVVWLNRLFGAVQGRHTPFGLAERYGRHSTGTKAHEEVYVQCLRCAM